MFVAVVPYRRVEDAPGLFVRAPDLPPGIAWGQASSRLSSSNRAVVWLDCDEATAAGIAARGRGFAVSGRQAPRAEAARLKSALRTERAPEPGRRWAVRDEFLAMYRPEAERIEAAEDRADAAKRLAKIVGMFGVVAVTSWLLRGWSPGWLTGGPLLGLTILHSDNFNRANSTLSGSTMSDGIGAWMDDGLSASIVSNEVSSSGLGACYDSVMSAVGVQRVSVKTRSNFAYPLSGGVIARCDPSANTGYIMLNGYYGNSRCYRADDYTTANFTQIISGSFNPSAGDTIAVDCDGSTIDFLHNGSSLFGPATDSTYATGVGGLAGYFAGYCDDWQVEVASAVGQPLIKRLGGIPYAAGLRQTLGVHRW